MDEVIDEKYYMVITSEFDFEIDIKNELSVICLPERHKNSVMKFKPGDKIVLYISKLSVIGGVAEVTSSYYYDCKRVWTDLYDVWPHRVNAKPIYLVDDVSKGIKIKDIWDDLTFIKNKHSKWGCYVQGSFKILSSSDYRVIENAFKNRML